VAIAQADAWPLPISLRCCTHEERGRPIGLLHSSYSLLPITLIYLVAFKCCPIKRLHPVASDQTPRLLSQIWTTQFIHSQTCVLSANYQPAHHKGSALPARDFHEDKIAAPSVYAFPMPAHLTWTSLVPKNWRISKHNLSE